MVTLTSEQKWVREDGTRKSYTTLTDFEEYIPSVEAYETACRDAVDTAISLSTIKVSCTITLHSGEILLKKFQCDNIH